MLSFWCSALFNVSIASFCLCRCVLLFFSFTMLAQHLRLSLMCVVGWFITFRLEEIVSRFFMLVGFLVSMTHPYIHTKTHTYLHTVFISFVCCEKRKESIHEHWMQSRIHGAGYGLLFYCCHHWFMAANTGWCLQVDFRCLFLCFFFYLFRNNCSTVSDA